MDPHYLLPKPKIHDQLQFVNRAIRDKSHASGNMALQKWVLGKVTHEWAYIYRIVNKKRNVIKCLNENSNFYTVNGVFPIFLPFLLCIFLMIFTFSTPQPCFTQGQLRICVKIRIPFFQSMSSMCFSNIPETLW